MIIYRGSIAHRYLSFSILALLVLLTVIIIWQSQNLKNTSQQDYEDIIFQINKYQHLVSSLPALQQKNEQLKQLVTSQKIVLTAQEPSILIAEQQQQLRQLAQVSHVRLNSIQANVASSNNELLIPLQVKLQLQASHQDLLELIKRLETRKPVGFIDSLAIQPIHQPQSSSDYLTKLNVTLAYRVYMEPLNVK